MPTRSPRRCRRAAFTLVELLVSVTLVLVVVLLSYKFFSNLQNIWQHSASRTSTHEDARLALGLIARDLQAVIAHENDLPGQDIRIDQPNASALWFVTESAADSSAACSLIEVGYRLREDRLERAFVDQSNAAWNIYGNRDDADDQGGYQTIIEGVTSLSFVCYDGQYVPAPPDQSAHLPTLISVRISVLDPLDRKRWLQLAVSARPAFERKAARTFWKTVRPP